MVKRRYVTFEESVDVMNEPGFRPVCAYGSIVPEDNEVGGVGVYKATCVERIFIKETE